MTSNCFHCGLINPSNNKDLILEIFGRDEYFCCLGCKAIAETLIQNNLGDFYKFRTLSNNQNADPNSSNNTPPQALIPTELEAIKAFNTPEIIDQISRTTDSANIREIDLGIEGMTCAACGWLIEKSIGKLETVVNISVNVTTNRATLTWHASNEDTSFEEKQNLSDILIAFNNIGFKAFPYTEDLRIESFKKTNQNYIKRLLVASLGMMQVMTYALAVYIGDYQDISPDHKNFMLWLSFIVATPVVFYSAKPFFKSAWQNLKARRLGMNFPVSLAILGAYFASTYALLFSQENSNASQHYYYFDSVVMFTFFLTIGRFLEHRARYQSILKQNNFQQMVPLSVKRFKGEETENVLVSKLAYGDKLIIPAGSVIPVDGILLENQAELNEAIMTGEFMPVTKYPDDKLISGSCNQSASLIMLVTSDFARSKINHLIELQQRAENLKPDSVTIADQISHWYVVALLVLLSISASIWWFVDPNQIFPTSLAILVVSCPCALSLATPAVHAAATAQLTDLGLMIKNPSTLTELSKINHVMFDKTGTLSEGMISIEKIDNFSEFAESQLIKIASILESISSHPIASAFEKLRTEFETNESESDQAIESFRVSNSREVIGQGVIANINAKRYLLGKASFLIKDNEDIFESTELSQMVLSGKQHHKEISELKRSYREHKGMAVFLSEDGVLIAAFHLQDKTKTSAKSCIEKLNSLPNNQTIDISILTGDTGQSAFQLAKELKITDVIANATPETKIKSIQNVQSKNKNVMMVGDGFNDVGALAAANVSISLASSPHFSKSKSDAVLVSNDLTVLPNAIELSYKVQRIIKQNIYWAIGYNLIAIPFAAFGVVPAWVAAIGMSASSLVVVLNALRLRT